MKKFLFVLFAFLSVQGLWAQQTSSEDRDSLLNVMSSRQYEMYVNDSMRKDLETFKLYPTENIYIFLRLNTSTGQIDMIQWNLDSDKEGVFPLNEDNLNIYNHPGMFELYPTKNMYQFILLQKDLGRMWHVQWGFKESERWIRRIDKW